MSYIDFFGYRTHKILYAIKQPFDERTDESGTGMAVCSKAHLLIRKNTQAGIRIGHRHEKDGYCRIVKTRGCNIQGVKKANTKI